MAAELIVAPEAQQDLDEAYDWYEERQAGLPEVFLTRVDGERLEFANLGAEVTALAWHPSGRSLAARTAEGGISVFAWNAP
jgi:hypothetical protein